MSQENVEIVPAVLDAYHRGDIEAMHALATRTSSWTAASKRRLAAVYRGIDGTDAFTRATFEAFEEVANAADRYIESR